MKKLEMQTPEIDFHVVIPARHDSKRFPGKPLADIMGKPMIQHVHERALHSGAQTVVVATDSVQIKAVCERFGATCLLTNTGCNSGTDRVVNICEQMGWDDHEVVVNLQGDEPLMPPRLITQVAELLSYYGNSNCEIATLYENTTDIANPNDVKVVEDTYGSALYFSRCTIPHGSDVVKRHIGIYAYTVGFLRNYGKMTKCDLEEFEHLEQLRALYYGACIKLEEADEPCSFDVNVPEDIDKIIKAITDENI